ncbi:pilus assembly protein TadG-related protein [Microlunatus sp. Gsoil 973]|jgi:hypothetical protein|uniref:pilus assembly protein TadG-related protein n=1 Tax=Microlunatus sp. Gsoil 973 TaxID=2672569 RepID=UPI0012B4BE6D|nr:pilus assembly protein TadG-related protein [Microlunatus sp. Gsoil 973]QGN34572.1 hypothetical protein GJV80_19045 [Microlunatus sp. Gsoil 973]
MKAVPTAQRDRGQAVSIMVLGFIAALIMVAGLVVDGGQKAAAMNRAETLASGAARAAANAGASGTLGADGAHTLATEEARRAAKSYLAAAAVDGASVQSSVRVDGTEVIVHTDIRVRTIFLSLVRINTLRAAGDATARVVPG